MESFIQGERSQTANRAGEGGIRQGDIKAQHITLVPREPVLPFSHLSLEERLMFMKVILQDPRKFPGTQSGVGYQAMECFCVDINMGKKKKNLRHNLFFQNLSLFLCVLPLPFFQNTGEVRQNKNKHRSSLYLSRFLFLLFIAPSQTALLKCGFKEK